MKPSALILYIGIVAVIHYNGALGYLVAANERKCNYSRKDKMLSATCYDMNLKEIPQFLRGSIEMLNVAYNRIKKLKKTSFQKYTSIRYLLMYENKVQSIEPGTFSHLTALEEIDLSDNALTTIPLELLNLPSLRNLYIDSNELINVHRDLESLEKPIAAPLEYLNIGDCGLRDIPYFGTLPRLWHLNASNNPLDELTIERISPFCGLKSIDLKNTIIPQCPCQVMLRFFAVQGVKLNYPINCDILDEGSCEHFANISLFNDEYSSCHSQIQIEKAKIAWATIVGCAAALIFLIIVIAYYCHSRMTNKANKTTKKPKNQERLMQPS